MPRASHRLDLALVAPPEVSDLARLVADMVAAGALPPEGAGRDGVFFGWRVEIGATKLYANRLGGFRVRCPSCGGNLVPAFSRVWRDHPDPSTAVDCPTCGARPPLRELAFAPPAAFGSAALVLVDVAEPAVAAPIVAAWSLLGAAPTVIALRP